MKYCFVLIICLIVSVLGCPLDYCNEIEGEVLMPEPAPEILDETEKVYHIFPTRANFVEATKQCHENNMKLVSILSKEENDNVIKAIKDANQGSIGFWTSGARRNTNSGYYWETGEPVTFTNWEHGAPDELHPHEDCIEIKGYNILKWNDHLCSYRLYYICEELINVYAY